MQPKPSWVLVLKGNNTLSSDSSGSEINTLSSHDIQTNLDATRASLDVKLPESTYSGSGGVHV